MVRDARSDLLCAFDSATDVTDRRADLRDFFALDGQVAELGAAHKMAHDLEPGRVSQSLEYLRHVFRLV